MRVSSGRLAGDGSAVGRIADRGEPRAHLSRITAWGKDGRPALAACQALRAGDTLVVWKLDRLGPSTSSRPLMVCIRLARLQGFKRAGASIDTTTPAGKLIFGIFAALAEYERELIRERHGGSLPRRGRGRAGDAPSR